MAWKEFFVKNKKILIIFFVILLTIGIAFFIYCLYLRNDKNHSQKNIDIYNNENLIELEKEKMYTKLIPESQEISDLKFVIDLTDLQKEMLLLMRENFVVVKPDWQESIKQGRAAFEGDFSKVLKENELKPYLKPQYDLGLLGDLPKDEENISCDIRGYNNFYKLRNWESHRWHFKLRDNLQFENQTEINNQVVKYSLEKHKEIIKLLYDIDKLPDNPDLPSNFKFLLETECDIDINEKYDFILSYKEKKDLHSVISLLNQLTLFSSDIFENTYSLNNGDIDKSNYGTSAFPFLSYGPYLLKQGYDSQKDWIFEKNDFFYRKNEYPLKNILYKKTNSSEEKYDLFNKDQINEIIIKDTKDISKINQNKFKNFLKKTISNSIYIFFKQEEIENEDDEILKQQKTKTNFFLNDARFRKALFLSLDRCSLLEKEDYFGLVPNFSFVSDLVKFTEEYHFNEQQFHQQNLNNIFNLKNIQSEQDINSKIYQPEQARQLLEEVNTDFNKQFPQFQQPLIIRIFTGFDETTEFRELKLTSFLIDSWKNVFSSLSDKIQFDQTTDPSFSYNVDLGPGFLATIKNPHQIFIYMYDQFEILDSLGKSNKRKFILKESESSEKEFTVGELQSFLQELQKKIDKKINNNKRDDFEKYCLILAQLEKKALEELYCLPLIKGTRYKIYQVLERDFKNSFLLWGLNDIC
ncbi:probable ABC transporter, periplasmic component (showing similarities to Botulinum neurotoxin) [Candidatus Phytoplasma mali]|uniref:Probable ABC transporter, periplasmic component (Showing similarities to Botulinum neurotoxin) n=1 Tax=Phytoplasma mali (strain AT) TaxID=482235 RepID=B3R0Q9_PHYMT|nr:ABC transporter substrate-binding protein [Candidatus Phytoplasma mali]CAP18643.1 probable ABC transporter, periplasmic component (showing similarities to Botulinum neurotoxin) [Candidatus Phytoplasma mali]